MASSREYLNFILEQLSGCVICIPDLISTSIKLSLKKSVRMPTFLLFNVKLNKKQGF